MCFYSSWASLFCSSYLAIFSFPVHIFVGFPHFIDSIIHWPKASFYLSFRHYIFILMFAYEDSFGLLGSFKNFTDEEQLPIIFNR